MKKQYLCAALLLVVIAVGGFVCAKSYWKEHTHEYALMQIRAAIEKKDAAGFAEYVDVERVLYGMHENASELLAAHIDALHERYPDDWFFRHDAVFMTRYMAERRTRDVASARAMLDYYFDEKRVPVTREDGAARWGADEMRVFAAHYTAASIALTAADEAHAVYLCSVRGDESTYGRLMPEGNVRLVLEKQDTGHWKLVQIETSDRSDNGFYAFVDGAERYWALQGWD